MEVIKQLLSNEYYFGVAMAVIIFGLTFLLKLPIKALTKKFSKSERNRKLQNIVIILIPFLLGLIAQVLYCFLYLHIAFTVFEAFKGLGYGSAAIAMYAPFAQRVKNTTGIDIENPFNTEEGKAVQELVEKVQDDGKINKSDLSAVDEFWQAIQQDKNNKQGGKKE